MFTRRHCDIRSSTHESRSEWRIDSDECSIFAITLDEVELRLLLFVCDIELFEIRLELIGISFRECMLGTQRDRILVFAAFEFLDYYLISAIDIAITLVA